MAAVLPEAGAHHYALITGHHAGPGGGPGWARWGDGVISRRDGLQVLVELTCTAGDRVKLRRKIRASVDLLLQAPFTAVVFVEAAGPDAAPSQVWTPLRRLVADVSNSLTGDQQRSVRDRLGVARWIDWFPGENQVSDEALVLAADCPTGPTPSGWRQVRFLDDFDLPLPWPSVTEAHRRLDRAVASPSNPYWLRDINLTVGAKWSSPGSPALVRCGDAH